MKIYCCEEHADVALDIIVDECNAVPIMEKLSTESELSTMCEHCRNKAIYSVFADKK